MFNQMLKGAPFDIQARLVQQHKKNAVACNHLSIAKYRNAIKFFSGNCLQEKNISSNTNVTLLVYVRIYRFKREKLPYVKLGLIKQL